MSKIYAFLPIDALAKFSIDKPGDWEEMTHDDKLVYFLNCCDPAYNVCNNCEHSIVLAREFNLDIDLPVHFDDSN